MAWRIIEVTDDDATQNDLTDSELVGVSVLLQHHCGEPLNDLNVYWRAARKVQPIAAAAIDREAT